MERELYWVLWWLGCRIFPRLWEKSVISAFSQLTATQIKFHHPFTLSDLVILKHCANRTRCQPPAAPPLLSGEKHIPAIGVYPYVLLKMIISPPLAKSIQRCPFHDHECSTTAAQGWERMRLDRGAPAETSGEQDGAGDQPQAGLKFQPGQLTELMTARPLLPAPPLGTQGGELPYQGQETGVSAAHGGCT